MKPLETLPANCEILEARVPYALGILSHVSFWLTDIEVMSGPRIL